MLSLAMPPASLCSGGPTLTSVELKNSCTTLKSVPFLPHYALKNVKQSSALIQAIVFWILVVMCTLAFQLASTAVISSKTIQKVQGC